MQLFEDKGVTKTKSRQRENMLKNTVYIFVFQYVARK